MLASNLNVSEYFPEKTNSKRKNIIFRNSIAEDEVEVEEFRCYFFNTVIVQIEDRFKIIPNIISDFKLITDVKKKP